MNVRSAFSFASKKYNLLFIFAVAFAFSSCGQAYSEKKAGNVDSTIAGKMAPDTSSAVKKISDTLDTAAYNKFLTQMTNKDSSGKWPVKAAYPLAGALLPFNRIVAFYGNLYSTKMGVLGEYPRKQMLAKLKEEVVRWQAADTSVNVIPALHYIAITAQGSPGKGNKYRLRMPFKQIDSVISMAREINALVFIDIQVGHSTVQEEVPLFEQYFKMPNVHFGIDPEFSMKGGQKPGAAIGTFDAADINFTADYMAKIVKENNLPPKILVIHRFTRAMVTNYKQIKLQPEIQVVMDMDGWGAQARKITTYKQFVYGEPVQFTGFKLFYKNDFREPKSRIMTPEEVLNLKPKPMYVQYQ
ncbi:MAG TPA: hypothetical protein VK645_15655 [Chitinophagaceae bacterium]|nr:hypothetical protein [Chitinophagaceae bacterium]